MTRWIHAVLACLCFVPAHALHYGQTREAVLQELGKPTSALRRGAREVLIYPQGGRIEFEADKVVFVQGLAVTEEPGSPAAAAAEPATAESSPAMPESRAEEKSAEPPADPAAATAPATEEGEEEEEKEMDPVAAEPEEEPESPFAPWISLGTNLLVSAAMMLAALKLTTKFWDLPIEWSGLLIAAGADTLVRFVLQVLGNIVLELPSMFFVDEILATCALVAVIRHVSDNKSLGRAVTIGMSSKIFSIVVGSMVAVAVMNGLF